jgi:hypothetical protein
VGCESFLSLYFLFFALIRYKTNSYRVL